MDQIKLFLKIPEFQIPFTLDRNHINNIYLEQLRNMA
jgi:hypothetical protein